MEPSDVLDDDGNLSIEVGKDVSRRDVMKKLGAVSAAMGMAGMAGCGGDGDDTDTPEDTTAGGNGNGNGNGTPTMGNGNGNGGMTAEDFEFSRHPAVAPPGWESDQTESGSGMSDRRCVFVIQNIENPFFVPLQCGFHDALNAFGYTGQVKGPGQDGSIQDQVSIIESEIDQMSAGDILVTTILDSQSYNDAIQSALDAGIVVINGHTTPATRDWNYQTQRQEFSFTSPVSGNDREMIIPHVGIRDARGGVAMAVEMQDRLESEYPDQDEYTVFLVNDLPDNPAVTRRVNKEQAEEGTAQRYYESQDNINIYQDQVFTTPQPPQVSTSRTFVTDNIAGEDIDAVVASAFWAAAGAGAARTAGEISGDTLVCGFDLAGMVGTEESGDPEAGPGPIASGDVDFVVGQDPYTQGFMNVPLAWMWAERGAEMKDFEWGVSVFDQQNIEFATQRRKWSGSLNDWQKNNYDGLTY